MTDEDDALASNEAFYRAFNQRDMDLMSALWADTDEVTCIHPGWNALVGRERVLDSWRAILGNPGQSRIVTGGATVTFHDDVAIVLCRELVAGSPLIATNVFVRESEGWKLVHHQSGPVASGG
jgi:ketosteroid isomerase-like protein